MQDERTLKMMQEFMSLREQGYSIKEIAKKFNLHPSTVYRLTSVIAKNNGCPKEALLDQPHAMHLTHDRQFEPVPEVDVKQYTEKFEALKKSAKELSSLMSQHIRELEKETVE